MEQRYIDIRKDILELARITTQGRLGTDYSVVEIIDSVYDYMSHNPKNPDWDDIKTLKSHRSKFGGHPDRLKVPGVEASTGSLGHGIGLAVGMALGLKIKKSDRKVYVLVGDGESNEGSVWESIMIAVNEKLDNLVIIFDVNQSQTRGLQLNNIGGVCREFGCVVEELLDGHDVGEIKESLGCGQRGKPLVIVANTIKGYPCKTLIDNKFEWHSKVPDDEYYNIFKDELDEKAV